MTNKVQNDVKVWADLALSDLKSAKILYGEKEYRTSYFLFQQAAEKAIKGYGLWAGIIRPNEVKGINHQQLRIVEKYLIGKIDGLKKEMEGDNKSGQKLEVGLQSLNTALEGLNRVKGENLLNIPSADLANLFKELSILSLPLARRFPGLKKVKTKKNVSKGTYSFLKAIFGLWTDFSFVTFTFLACSMLTVQHSTLPRYPQDGKVPQRFYTGRLAMIKYQGKFMDLLEKAIKRFLSLKTKGLGLEGM